MPTPLFLLILEDRASDAELMVAELRHAGFDPQYERVDRRADYIARLTPSLDVILADYSVPGFNAKRALRVLQERGLDIPFIVVSGTIEEENAVALIRQGATDYLLKDRLARLGQAVTRALEEKKLRHESARAEQALRENERRFRLIAENARDLISILDPNGQYLYASPSHIAALGYPAETLLTLNTFDLVHPDDVARVQNWENTSPLEFRLRRADGEWLWMEGSSYTIVEQGEPLVVQIARDITERKHTQAELEHRATELGALYDENLQLFEQVRASRERLQVLSRRLLLAQESERRNIARELHDEIGQALTGVQLNLQAIEPALARKSARATLQDAMMTIERTLQQVRDLSLNLRPSILDDFGLVPALKWLVEQQMRRANLIIEFTPDLLEQRAPIEIETACFRVVQEALTNTVRHAHATHVSVRLQCIGPAFKLVIQDDGTGFDTALALRRAAGGASLGLLGLQERVSLAGGQIEIQSAPGQGTRIEATFPLTSTVAFIERRIHRRHRS